MHGSARVERIKSGREHVEIAMDLFQLLVDATWIQTVLALQDGELSVNHLADTVERNLAAVSHTFSEAAPGQTRLYVQGRQSLVLPADR